jgi:hypothetical protein
MGHYKKLEKMYLNANIKKKIFNSTTAHGRIQFSSSNLFTAEYVLVNDREEEVALGTENFAKSKIALTEKIGY